MSEQKSNMGAFEAIQRTGNNRAQVGGAMNYEGAVMGITGGKSYVIKDGKPEELPAQHGPIVAGAPDAFPYPKTGLAAQFPRGDDLFVVVDNRRTALEMAMSVHHGDAVTDPDRILSTAAAFHQWLCGKSI